MGAHLGQQGRRGTARRWRDVGALLGLSLACSCGRGLWGDPSSEYSLLEDRGNWSAFDVTRVDPAARTFFGGVYDGRYVYCAPFGNDSQADVTRYDTSLPFGSTGAWSTFDVSGSSFYAHQFKGAAFDGRFVYLVPGVAGTFVERYDTHASYASTDAWSTFDVTVVHPAARALVTATFDGRYIYFAPWSDTHGSPVGLLTRYDTQAEFTSIGSWTVWDVSTLDPAAAGFGGSLFDGHYVYLYPGGGQVEGGAAQRAVFARYDTGRELTSPDSWSIFDLTTLAGGPVAFSGATYDGRHAYFAPFGHGRVVRYDSTAPFTTGAGWSIMNVEAVDEKASGFSGAVFDGRHVYLVPDGSKVPGGALARYDTSGDFTSPAAWSAFDLTAIADARAFQGGVFAGRHVYFIGGQSGWIVRFEARSSEAPVANDGAGHAVSFY